ncbi:MAG: alpha/beta hydrolase family protein [Chloroflexia bacterium]
MDILSLPPPPSGARLSYGPDEHHFGELRLPPGDGPHPTLIVIHGGFWRARYDLLHIGHLSAALTAAGFATWTIEYRRLGNPGGGYPGTFHDVAQATRHLTDLAPHHNLDLSRVATIGHSAGGHLAFWLAACHNIPPGDPLHVDNPLPLAGAISLAGVSDLRRAWELGLSDTVVEQLLGGTPFQVPARYAAASPIELRPLGVPQTLIHGTEDDIVPYEISVRYHAAAQSTSDAVHLIPLPGAGHFEPIDPRSKEWPTVESAVRSLLQP